VSLSAYHKDLIIQVVGYGNYQKNETIYWIIRNAMVHGLG
jgi:hypothetical protein